MDQPTLTAKLLLELTQSHKFQCVKRNFKHDIGLSDHIVVTQDDIEVMADTVKFHLFYVPGCVIREAIELAQKFGVLGRNVDYLKADTKWAAC